MFEKKVGFLENARKKSQFEAGIEWLERINKRVANSTTEEACYE